MAPLKGIKTKYKNKQLTTSMSHKVIVAFIVKPRPHQTETSDERKNSKLLKTLLWIRSLQQSNTLTVVLLIFCCCLFLPICLTTNYKKPASRKHININIFSFFLSNRQAVEFLSNEGHIFSTIDEDHYKSTDGDA